MNFAKKHLCLSMILLLILKMAYCQQANLADVSTCSSSAGQKLLQSGTYALINYRQSLNRQHNFQIVVNYNIPTWGFNIAVSTGRIDGYNPAPGTDYSIRGGRFNNTNIAFFILLINDDLSWSTIRASFFVSSRTDFFLGGFFPDTYNLFYSNASFVAQYVMPGWTPTSASVSYVYLISGLKSADSNFNVALAQGGFNTQTGLISVRISSNASPTLEMIYISYMLFYNTAPYTLRAYNPLLVSPQASYFYEGINSFNGNIIIYEGYGINSTLADSNIISCIGRNCPSSCVTPLRCTQTNGLIFLSQCFMCAFEQVYSNGQCLSRCPVNQRWSGVSCECESGSTRIAGICIIPNCGVNQVINGNQCICVAGYERRNGVCQQICPAASNWNGRQCFCVQGYVKVGDRCFFQCTANGYLTDNRVCSCLNGFTKTTSGQCVSACGINQVYETTAGQCLCRDGFLLYKNQCTSKCSGNFSNAVIFQGVCICIQGFDAVGGRCVRRITCANPFQIVVNGRCICQTGYRYNLLGLCIPNCGLNQFLNNNFCECVNGYSRNTLGVCVRTCPANQIQFGNTCQCANGFVRNNQGSCSRTCSENQYIAGNICVCAPGYIRSSTTGSCIKLCQANEYLLQNQCLCVQGYVRNIAGICVLQTPTCGQNQLFVNNRCECQEGFRRSNNVCVSVCRVTFNEIYDIATKSCVCRDGYGLGLTSGLCERCPANSRSSGFLTACICNDRFRWNEMMRRCEAIICAVNRTFVNGICICNTGFYQDGNECKLIPNCPARSTWIQARLQCSCTSANEYLINRICQTCQINSVWNQTDCVCRSGYFLIRGQCIQCSPNSQYSRGNCACNIGYFGDGIRCDSCYQTCGTCSSPAVDACLTCINASYSLRGGICTSRTCDIGNYRNTPLNRCDKCLNYCASCTNSNDCSQCIDGFNIQRISGLFSSITCIELCGDGKRITDQCDDGNTNNADGCSSSCKVENGWTCVGGTSTSRSQCSNISPTASLILPGGHVILQGVVYQGVSITYLPSALTAGGCANCDNIFNVSVTKSQVIPIISVDYVSPTQYKFAIKFDFGGLTGLFAFTFMIRINNQFSPYFTAADMQQVKTITIDPATLAKVQLLGQLSFNKLQIDTTSVVKSSQSNENVVIQGLPAEAIAILFPV